MAQTSTTLIATKAHVTSITGTDISFTATAGVYTIKSTSTVLTGSVKLAVGDLITVTGTSSNNSTFTVSTVVSTLEITVSEVVTTETAGSSFTLDHVGFVSDKAKGDGYYSQPDGVHTVAYQVNSTMTGLIKMQGSLATDPDDAVDWFDIDGTTAGDDSTVTATQYINFTGNFVWVRSSTNVVTGSVTKILLNF